MSRVRFNIDAPRYDLSTFEGRAKDFFAHTNPLNILASDEEVNRAIQIVESYRACTEDKNLTDDEIWQAKELYDLVFGNRILFPPSLHYLFPKILPAPTGNVTLLKPVSIDGKTGLHLAVENGHVEVVVLLLNAGASLSITDSYGRTPLAYAAMEGNIDLVSVMMTAQISQAANLMMHGYAKALKNRNVKGVELSSEMPLLFCSVYSDLGVKDIYGKSPLDYAAENNCLNLLGALEEGVFKPLMKVVDENMALIDNAKKRLKKNQRDVAVFSDEFYDELSSPAADGNDLVSDLRIYPRSRE